MSKMPFGAHKGMEISSIPESYLQWVLDNCSNLHKNLRAEIEEIVRGDGEVTIKITPKVLRLWYTQLLFKFHPNKEGGSEAACKAIIEANDMLKRLARANQE